MLRSMMQVYVKGSSEAVQLYQKAFDAKFISEHKNDDGSYMHAELDVFGQVLALSESGEEISIPCSFACISVKLIRNLLKKRLGC